MISIAASGSVGICKGGDDAIWFVEITGNFTEYSLPTQDVKPHAIVSGKESELWFTEWGSNQIGRIKSCGKIIEYQIPTIGSEPHGLVLGPGGAIWLTEECGKIGQLIY